MRQRRGRIVRLGGRIAVVVVSLAVIWCVGAPGAGAGGWAMTSVDDLPAAIAAGTPTEIELTVLQHGRTPVDGETITVVVGPIEGEELRFPAAPTGEPGHYRARVVVDTAGTWPWHVVQGLFGPQDLGHLNVGAAGAAPAVSSSDPLLAPPAARVGLTFGAALAVLVAAVLWRGRSGQRGPAPA